MSDKVTEIVISYKSLPHNIFSASENIPNKLVIRLQPPMRASKCSCMFKKSKLHRFPKRIPDDSGYERLFLDVIRGDQSLFVGREEVEESWRWCDTLIEAWRTQGVEVKGYRAGSNGPTRAELLIENDGRSWHES